MNRLPLIENILPFLAALFAYLSWKRSTLGNPYDSEDTIRNRLEGSANVTDYYSYELGRVNMSEYDGWGYEIWKYLPYVGGTRGKTVLYLYFFSPEGDAHILVPSEEEIRQHSKFEFMPISSITWREEIPHMSNGERNLEIVLDTVDPDMILETIVDLSGVMIEINSESE